MRSHQIGERVMKNSDNRDGKEPFQALTERRRRQAEALRRNLGRRKAQERARDRTSQDGDQPPRAGGRRP